MKYIGLLTDAQKRAGYFITQDEGEDFVYLWHGRDSSNPEIVAVFLYDDARIKQVREAAEKDMKGAIMFPKYSIRGCCHECFQIRAGRYSSNCQRS